MPDTKITALTLGVPLTTDIMPYVSDPGGSPVTKKTLVSSLIPAPAKMAGDLVQAIHTASGAEAHGSTVVPLDDTVPTSSEGDALAALDTTITPTSVTNRLLIEVILIVNPSSTNYVVASIFQDSGAAALKTGIATAAAGYYTELIVRHEMAAGTTSATTFKVRYGGTNPGTITINGLTSARQFGGALCSSMRVSEIKV